MMIALIAAIGLAAFCCGTRAQADGESRSQWGILRLQGVLIVPLGENRAEGWNDCGSGWVELLNFYSSIDAKSSGGIVASFEYVLKRKYGIEASLAYWGNIAHLYFEATGITIEGSPNFIMPTLGVNYHFLTDEKKDIYAGPLFCLGVMATGFGTDIDVSKDVALGLKFGMDYYIKKSWSLGSCLEYIDFGQMDFSLLPAGLEGIICNNGLFGAGSMNFISVTFGAGYRF
jgi:opacity protein-like surface antigen